MAVPAVVCLFLSPQICNVVIMMIMMSRMSVDDPNVLTHPDLPEKTADVLLLFQ